jgi:pimeloyl-ACP methyl ester carboxylesterase
VWGACDRITPVAWGRELARRLDAPLAIIDQAGHFPNIERPDAFEDVVLRFVHECLV